MANISLPGLKVTVGGEGGWGLLEPLRTSCMYACVCVCAVLLPSSPADPWDSAWSFRADLWSHRGPGAGRPSCSCPAPSVWSSDPGSCPEATLQQQLPPLTRSAPAWSWALWWFPAGSRWSPSAGGWSPGAGGSCSAARPPRGCCSGRGFPLQNSRSLARHPGGERYRRSGYLWHPPSARSVHWAGGADPALESASRPWSQTPNSTTVNVSS